MKTQILITAMIAAVALPAYAGGSRLKAMDLNGDGKVTVSEAVEARVAKFDGADTNGNGSLDKGEHTAMLEALNSQRKRGGGAKRTGNADPFTMTDADGNGSMDKGEHTAMLEALNSQRKRGGGAKRTGNADPFTMTDADGNGSISKAEFRFVAEQFFARVDADGNGELTRSDFRALRSQKSG
ncbi:EF-hand domain-containing protein [Leisingera sp. D0M16]|uniref:EF-hand domain-containing protein n=1 Tax=Leisingera coralii TaxID=3351347 RepID=UPI003B77BEE9